MSAANRKNDTLQRILVAARTEFAEKGFDGARLDNVARAANVTKQLIHYYFQTKDELYRVVFEATSQAVIPLLDAAAYEALTPTEAIRLLINRVIDLHAEKQGVTTFTLDQSLHRAAHINDQTCFVTPTREFIQNVIDPILKRGARSGEFRSGVDTTLFYATVFHVAAGCFLMGHAMTQTIGLDFETPEGVALWRAHALDFILASLRAAPSDAVGEPNRTATVAA